MEKVYGTALWNRIVEPHPLGIHPHLGYHRIR